MSGFNYKEKSAPKLSDDFKKKFIVNIGKGGTEAIKVDGLIALAHEKGLKSMKTKIIQFPSQENQWTCIASTTVVGYDWNPITDQVEEVEYEDFADANANNCTTMTKASYIRMASTRSVGRALRKYTNIDMVCSDEIANTVDNFEPPIEVDELVTIKNLCGTKHVTPDTFGNIMMQKFGHTNYQGLTQKQGQELIAILNNLPVQQQPQVQPQAQQPQVKE